MAAAQSVVAFLRYPISTTVAMTAILIVLHLKDILTTKQIPKTSLLQKPRQTIINMAKVIMQKPRRIIINLAIALITMAIIADISSETHTTLTQNRNTENIFIFNDHRKQNRNHRRALKREKYKRNRKIRAMINYSNKHTTAADQIYH